MGIGSEPQFYGIEGLEENGLTLWSYKDALKIKDHIISMFDKAAKKRIPILENHILLLQ